MECFKTAITNTPHCYVVLACFATYWVAKMITCHLTGGSQNVIRPL